MQWGLSLSFSRAFALLLFSFPTSSACQCLVEIALCYFFLTVLVQRQQQSSSAAAQSDLQLIRLPPNHKAEKAIHKRLSSSRQPTLLLLHCNTSTTSKSLSNVPHPSSYCFHSYIPPSCFRSFRSGPMGSLASLFESTLGRKNPLPSSRNQETKEQTAQGGSGCWLVIQTVHSLKPTCSSAVHVGVGYCLLWEECVFECVC